MPNRRPLLAIGLLAFGLVVLYGLTAFHQQSALFDGQRVFWLQDDMMISMRYARNLARGEGLVWNTAGERVEGYSNLGWVLVMALVHCLPLPNALTSLPVIALNIALAAAALALTARLLYQLAGGERLLWPTLAALLSALALNYDLARWAIIGLETTLQTVLFLGLLGRVLAEAEAGRPRRSTFVLAGLLGVVRVDGVLLAGTLWLLALALNPRRGGVVRSAWLMLLFPLACMAFRLGYYGRLAPNTYWLKVVGWPLSERLVSGLKYAALTARSYGIPALVAGFVVWRRRDLRLMAVWLSGLPLLVYALWVGGDDFSGARFLAPWLPALLALAFLAPAWLAAKRKGWYLLSLMAIWLAVVGLAGFDFTAGVSLEAQMVRVGLGLQRLTAADSRVAIFPAGALPYFAERPAVDLLGKNDAYIASLPAHAGIGKPGHNKFDFDYSLGVLEPDVIVSVVPPDWMADPLRRRQLLQGEHAAQGQLYLSPIFQSRYASWLSVVEGMAVFVRDDSPEQARLMSGHCWPVTDAAWSAFGLETLCQPK